MSYTYTVTVTHPRAFCFYLKGKDKPIAEGVEFSNGECVINIKTDRGYFMGFVAFAGVKNELRLMHGKDAEISIYWADGVNSHVPPSREVS